MPFDVCILQLDTANVGRQLERQASLNYRPLAVTLQLLSAILEGKVKVWNAEMSTNVKRATRKGLLPDYHSILEIIFNIIHVFFSKTFFVLFCFPSNMAAKYAVRHGVTSHESGLLPISDNVSAWSYKVSQWRILDSFNKLFDSPIFLGSRSWFY